MKGETAMQNYSEMYAVMTGPYATEADRAAAARAIDWDIARKAAKADLERQGIDREPTESEVYRIFDRM